MSATVEVDDRRVEEASLRGPSSFMQDSGCVERVSSNLKKTQYRIILK